MDVASQKCLTVSGSRIYPEAILCVSSQGKGLNLLSGLWLETYHRSTNLVIVKADLFFPEEILDVLLRRQNSPWEKDVKVINKVLENQRSPIINTQVISTDLSIYWVRLHWPMVSMETHTNYNPNGLIFQNQQASYSCAFTAL